MATQISPTPTPTPSAQVVGNAFVEQYYHILHQSPDLVFRFYTDSSVLSRPGPDGKMVSVKTMQAINEVILSLDYKEYKAEIQTIDAQDSYKEGVVVLVTGLLTVKDSIKRKFTQSFFLAPQDRGYFVLNDVFRYMDDHILPETAAVVVNDAPESAPVAPVAPVTPEPEPSQIPDQPVAKITAPAALAEEVVYENGGLVPEPAENGDISTPEVQADEIPAQEVQKEVPVVTEQPSTVQEDAPKKSYASIVKVKSRVPTPVYVPTGKVTTPIARKPAVINAEQNSAPEAPAPSSNNGTNSNIVPEEVEGFSIYVRSLPLSATVAQVEEEFKKFGAIKPNGVQVRSNKGFCFGFVEFISFDSKQSALEASPVSIGGKPAHVEEKRTTTKVGPSGRPRSTSGRTGFRSDSFRGNDNFRGRGNFNGGGGGRGYGRNEYGSRDFSGRRGPGRGGDNYQRSDNAGNGRVGRQGAFNQTAVTAA